MAPTLLGSRADCPCCGYPTISERGADDICRLCWWHDDGQDDADADEVRGGPNRLYSLTDGRRNFLRYRIFCAPGDPKTDHLRNPLEYDVKGELMAAYDRLRSAPGDGRATCEAEVERLEHALRDCPRPGRP
jgi:hypothetical protein